MAIIINTVHDHHERGYSISCWCPRCKGFVKCGLHRLLMRGTGDKPLSQVRIRHACGTMVEIRRIPPYGNQMPAGQR
jgi:hypothetical protein